MGFGDPAFSEGHDLTLDLIVGMCNHCGVTLLPNGQQIRYYPKQTMRADIPDIIRIRRDAMLRCLSVHDPAVRYDMPVKEMIRLAEKPPRLWPYGWEFWPVTQEAYRRLAACESKMIEQTDWHGRRGSRGIVMVGGGTKYFPGLYVAVKLIRHYGSKLPIEIWHLGRHEMDTRMERLLCGLGKVRCVDASARQVRLRNGWELKAHAILESDFQHVVFMDSDDHPLRKLDEMFDWPEYRQHGALVWPECPEMPRWPPESYIWDAMDVAYHEDAKWETGQLVIDKARCHRAIQMARHYDQHADYYYRMFWGDTGSFAFGFLRTETPFAIPGKFAHMLPMTICHDDFQGQRIWQHRSGDKVRMSPPNGHIEGYADEDVWHMFGQEIRERWDGKIRSTS